MRLIDADALAERTEVLEDFFVTNWTTEKVQRLIHEAPTIDAVPVVRCKDCESHGNCFLEDTFNFARIDNPFCCVGRRRSDD